MHFNKAKLSNNQNTNEKRSETAITQVPHDTTRNVNIQDWKPLIQYNEGMSNYGNFVSVLAFYYSSDMVNNSVLINGLWHELLKTLWLV